MNEFEKILAEYAGLTSKLASGGGVDIVKSGKRRAELEPIVEKIKDYRLKLKELADNEKLLDDKDPEIAALAKSENENLKSKILNLKSSLEEALLPSDPRDENDCLMEIRAGAGGNESSLFSAQLYRMYARFAESRGWKTHIISTAKSEAGGFKEVILEISASVRLGRTSADRHGRQVYGQLKFESGVHRVQRVPETEKSGRVHTSTVTVAVLPIIEEQDFKIAPSDLKIETSTSRGAGGQGVNTTYSAIKITHLPTGITASSQDERSQLQNRAKALQVLTSRVYAHLEAKKQKALSQKRKLQIGTGDRSEKIRTYNFPQDRVTDHRINQNFNQINLILEGKLGEIVEALRDKDRQLKKRTYAGNAT